MAFSLKTLCVPPNLDAQGPAALNILIQTALMELDVDGLEPLTITAVNKEGTTTGFLVTARSRAKSMEPTVAPTKLEKAI